MLFNTSRPTEPLGKRGYALAPLPVLKSSLSLFSLSPGYGPSLPLSTPTKRNKEEQQKGKWSTKKKKLWRKTKNICAGGPSASFPLPWSSCSRWKRAHVLTFYFHLGICVHFPFSILPSLRTMHTFSLLFRARKGTCVLFPIGD